MCADVSVDICMDVCVRMFTDNHANSPSVPLPVKTNHGPPYRRIHLMEYRPIHLTATCGRCRVNGSVGAVRWLEMAFFVFNHHNVAPQVRCALTFVMALEKCACMVHVVHAAGTMHARTHTHTQHARRHAKRPFLKKRNRRMCMAHTHIPRRTLWVSATLQP